MASVIINNLGLFKTEKCGKCKTLFAVDTQYTGWSKMAQFLYALTLPNINRFLKLFHKVVGSLVLQIFSWFWQWKSKTHLRYKLYKYKYKTIYANI